MTRGNGAKYSPGSRCLSEVVLIRSNSLSAVAEKHKETKNWISGLGGRDPMCPYVQHKETQKRKRFAELLWPPMCWRLELSEVPKK